MDAIARAALAYHNAAMDITWKELIARLEARGWTASELARRIGKSPAAICDIKKDRTAEPKGMAAVILHQIYITNALPAKVERVSAA